MDDSNVHSYPGQLGCVPRAIKVQSDSVDVQKKRQKFLSVKQQVCLRIWFLSSFRKQWLHLLCSCELELILLQSTITHGKREPAALKPQPWPVAPRAALATVGLAVLFYQIKPPLTSTSLFFSLFLPTELLPLLAVSRAGITEIWWRGILAGPQAASP